MSYTNGLDKPSDYFETLTWSGNSTDDRAISGLDFAPNWVWIKCRNNGQNHNIFDTVRGATESLESNNSNAENTDSTSLKSFTSDGYTLGTGSTVNSSSPSTKTYVGWNWKAGTAFTNDASATGIGTIDSTGSVNTTSGFSIVSYTGTAANATVGHGLSSVPKMIIFKNRNGTQNWIVYNENIGNTGFLRLSATNATDTGINMFQNTSPTSSVFSVSTDGAVNGSSNGIIAYCFAEKQGYSKFGSYTGGSDAFVYLGFKPSFIMFKNASAVENWRTVDNKRDIDNPVVAHLYPNLSNAEGSGAAYSDYIDFLSNGFKIRSSSVSFNNSGDNVIYMCFAENPFVSSTGVPATAR